MSSPQPSPSEPWGASTAAQPTRRSGWAAVPWLVGAVLLLAVALTLSATTDQRALADADTLPAGVEEWERAGSATDDEADDGPADDAPDDEETGDDAPDVTPDDGSGGAAEGHDVRAEAFREVVAGDCLDNYDTGDGWNAAVPVPGECGTDSGVMFVSSVRGDPEECDAGAGLGYWSHTGEDGETVALCLIRQFREDQCLLAKQSDGDIEDANLLSRTECGTEDPPDDWNHTVRVTAVYQAPEEMYDGACARYAGDQESYYYWMVDSERVLVCGQSDD